MFDPSGEIDPAARLTRAQALTCRGYKVAPATLATLATRGGGPPFAKFGVHLRVEFPATVAAQPLVLIVRYEQVPIDVDCV